MLLNESGRNMKLTSNKLKILTLAVMLSLAPAEMAKAAVGATATNCTIDYTQDQPVQQCSGSEATSSDIASVSGIIYQTSSSPTKIPEPSTTVGILIAVGAGYFSKRKNLVQQR